MIRILLAAVVLLSAAPAYAQQVHGKGPNGGPYEDIAGVHLEMLASGRVLTFNVFDEAVKPVPTKGYTGSVLVVSGGERETIPLTAGDNTMKAEAKKDIAPGASISVTLKTAEGKSGQVRFKK